MRIKIFVNHRNNARSHALDVSQFASQLDAEASFRGNLSVRNQLCRGALVHHYHQHRSTGILSNLPFGVASSSHYLRFSRARNQPLQMRPSAWAAQYHSLPAAPAMHSAQPMRLGIGAASACGHCSCLVTWVIFQKRL